MHQRVKLPRQKCCCRYYFVCRKMAAKKKWDKIYIDFDIAVKTFQSLNLQLMDIMVLDNEKLKQKLVDQFLGDQKTIFKTFVVFSFYKWNVSFAILDLSRLQK